MKKTKIISLCGVIAALITAIMASSYFPYLTYAIPALAGAFVIIPLFEIGKKAALLTYAASLLPVFLLAEPEAKLMYIALFGYYPVLKAVFEAFKSRALEYICKFVIFNLSVSLIYFVFAGIFGIEAESFGQFAKYGVIALYILGNVAFLLYDICLTRLAAFYAVRLHSKIGRIFKF